MKNCIQCQRRFPLYSSKYYCCNKQQAVCSYCRSNSCKKCKNKRMNEIINPKCCSCNCRIYDDKEFEQKKCGKHFCSKCLVRTFKNAYHSIKQNELNSLNQNKTLIMLPCDHECEFRQLKKYFENYCIECGKDYRQVIDKDLKNGIKLCFLCSSLFEDKYQELNIKCNICGDKIRNMLGTGIQTQDLVLCVKCFQQSQIEEKHLQKMKQLDKYKIPNEQYDKFDKYKYELDNQPQIIQDIRQKIVNQQQFWQAERINQQSFKQKTFEQVFSQKKHDQKLKKNQQKLQQKEQQNKEEKVQKRVQKDQKNKLIQKDQQIKQHQRQILQNNWINPKNRAEQKLNSQQIKDFKQQEEKIKYFKESQCKVVNQLQNEQIELNQQFFQQLGLQNKPVLRKYLSDQTVVQQLNLQIQLQKQQIFVKCKSCNIQINTKSAINTNAQKIQSKPKSLSSLIINHISSASFDKELQSHNVLCKVCYFKTLNKKQILDKTISTNDRSFKSTNSQRRQLFQSKVSTNNDSSRLNLAFHSLRKDSYITSNSAYGSSYGLTGARPSSIATKDYKSPLQLKNSLYGQKRQVKPATRQKYPTSLKTSIRQNSLRKPTQEKINIKLNELIPQRRTNSKYLSSCSKCNANWKQIIHGLDGKKYCKDCYITKNPSIFSDIPSLGPYVGYRS